MVASLCNLYCPPAACQQAEQLSPCVSQEGPQHQMAETKILDTEFEVLTNEDLSTIL